MNCKVKDCFFYENGECVCQACSINEQGECEKRVILPNDYPMKEKIEEFRNEYIYYYAKGCPEDNTCRILYLIRCILNSNDDRQQK